MKEIYVFHIASLCGGKILCGNSDLELKSFCTDSRKVQKGDVYVGIEGEVYDGSSFYQEAIDKGAVACILKEGYEYNTDQDCTIVVVEDTLKCLQDLAKYKRSLYDIPVIAITGSVGKTSTKDLVASVVSKKYKTHKTSGNYNNHLGVPLTILGMKEDTEALVIEMGMNHLREISVLSNIVKPTISIITNIGTAHIGNLGSRENILKAKLEILEGMIGNHVVINQDNDMLSSVVEELKNRYDVKTVSIEQKSNYQAINLKEDVFGSCFDILDECQDIEVQVGGKAYIYNSLVAYAVGKILEIDEKKIKEGILDFKLSSSRLEKKVMKNGAVLIDDTYNANYDSMKSSIELLGKIKDKRRIAILGDMLELGEYTEKFHIGLGEKIVEQQIDVLITVGEYSKYIERKALELGMNNNCVYHFDKESDSHNFLDNFIKENDVVLLKGSHGIHLIGIVDYLMNL